MPSYDSRVVEISADTCCRQIAAQPNFRHAIIDTSAPLVDTAEIHSITKASNNPPIDENERFDMGDCPEERIHHERPEPNLEDDVMPWMERSDDNSDQGLRRRKRRSIHVGERSVYGTEDYGQPLTLDEQTGSPDHAIGGSPSQPNRQFIRLGERSVYGTEDAQEPLFGPPTAFHPDGHVAPEDGDPFLYQAQHAFEWSGDTLVASQAQQFIHLNQPSTRAYPSNALSVPRKRASPRKTPREYLSVGGAFGERMESRYEEDPVDVARPVTELGLADHGQEWTESALSEQESCLSNGSVLFRSSRDATNKDEKASSSDSGPTRVTAGTTLTQPGHSSPPKFADSPTSPTKDIHFGKVVTKRPWQSPSLEDQSPNMNIRRRARRSLDASSNMSRYVFSELFLQFSGYSSSHHTRHMSPNKVYGSGNADPECCYRDRTSETRRTKARDRRIRSRSLSQLYQHRGTRAGPRIPLKSSKSECKALTLGRAGGKKTKPSIDNAATPSRSRIHHQQFHCPGKPADRSSIDDPGYYASLDSDHSDTAVQVHPRKTRDPTSPDISDRPWLRRGIPSSKYFPEDTASPSGTGPMRQPFWINYEGKLIVCFPNNVDPDVYEIQVHAKVHLSEPDRDGWQDFIIPGLPSLDESQSPGPISLSLLTPLIYQFDLSLLQQSFACGPNLVAGHSRFGPSPILRVLNEALSLTEEKALESSVEDRVSSARRRQLLASLSLEDGTPNDELCLWLLGRMRNAMSGGPCGEPYDMWFAQMDFGRVRIAIEKMLHKDKGSAASLPDDITLDRNITQAEKTNPLEDGGRTDAKLTDGILPEYENDKLRLPPAYFAGLACALDPMDYEDLSNLAWNFELSIAQTINGKLQCRLGIHFLPGATPLLTIDARDWVPNFATVNRQLSAQSDWQETEEGNLVLHRVTPLVAGVPVKAEIHFQERSVDGQSRIQGESNIIEFRLPNVVNKVILGGLLRCKASNAIVTLTDRSCEDVAWTADSTYGQDEVALPKLCQGYRMYLSIRKTGPPEEEDFDLETLPDMDSILDPAAPCPMTRAPGDPGTPASQVPSTPRTPDKDPSDKGSGKGSAKSSGKGSAGKETAKEEHKLNNPTIVVTPPATPTHAKRPPPEQRRNQERPPERPPIWPPFNGNHAARFRWRIRIIAAIILLNVWGFMDQIWQDWDFYSVERFWQDWNSVDVIVEENRSRPPSYNLWDSPPENAQVEKQRKRLEGLWDSPPESNEDVEERRFIIKTFTEGPLRRQPLELFVRNPRTKVESGPKGEATKVVLAPGGGLGLGLSERDDREERDRVIGGLWRKTEGRMEEGGMGDGKGKMGKAEPSWRDVIDRALGWQQLEERTVTM